MAISLEKKRYDILEIVSDAVRSMSEGELLQLQKSRKMNIKEDDYYRIIRSKTAALIAACTASGAKSVSEDPEAIRKMKDFGENIGIAFQIRDDLLDYEPNGLTGKLTGNDIKERKITLPLIYALENTSVSERRQILSIVKNRKKTKAEINQVIDFVRSSGGPEYTEQKMNFYRDKALEILGSYPDTAIRDSLTRFVNYTASRNK